MMSRKQIYLRALSAGVAAGLLASGFLVWRYRYLSPPPQFPLELPETVSWANRSVTRLPDGGERVILEAFAADGKNFRLEVGAPGARPVVFVHDGTDLRVNASVPRKTAAQLDPRNTILGAYGSLPGFRYLGVRPVGKHPCWAFEQSDQGIRSRFWVDVRTKTPRQIILSYPDGRVDTQTYVDLPAHRVRQPDLFNIARLSPMLLAGAEAMLGH